MCLESADCGDESCRWHHCSDSSSSLLLVCKAGDEEEADEEGASAGAAAEETEPRVKLVPKWKATRITEMLPDATVSELIDDVRATLPLPAALASQWGG